MTDPVNNPAHAALLNHASVTGATCCHPLRLWLQLMQTVDTM